MDLGASILSTFSWERALKKESVRRLWSSIFYAAIESTDKSNKYREITRYKPINQLLKSYMEKTEEQVKFARRVAALNVWVRIFGAIVALNIAESEEHYLPATGSWYFLTGRDCLGQSWQNNFWVQEGRSPELFLLVSGSKSKCLSVCLSRTLMHTTRRLRRRRSPNCSACKNDSKIGNGCGFLVNAVSEQWNCNDVR